MKENINKYLHFILECDGENTIDHLRLINHLSEEELNLLKEFIKELKKRTSKCKTTKSYIFEAEHYFKGYEIKSIDTNIILPTLSDKEKKKVGKFIEGYKLFDYYFPYLGENTITYIESIKILTVINEEQLF